MYVFVCAERFLFIFAVSFYVSLTFVVYQLKEWIKLNNGTGNLNDEKYCQSAIYADAICEETHI